jgi:cell division protein FtsL
MKKIDWSQWFLFLIGVVVVEAIAIYLLWNAYPGHEMKVMGWGILILVIGFAGYATYKANEPDNLVRQTGIIGKVILALLGVASLYGHSAMSRELSTAREGFTEFKQKTAFQQQVKDRDAQRNIELARAQSETMAAQARLESAQAQKLRLLDPSQRRIISGGSQRPAQPTPTPASAFGQTETEAVTTAEPKTETQVREEWLSFFQVVNMLQILIAVLSALAVTAVRHWDRVGLAGVPDWLERVYHSGANGRQYVESNYPDVARQIQAGGQPVYAGN